MAIEAQCGQCFKQYRVGDDKAGKRFKCRECGSPVTIPAQDDFGGEFDDFGGGDWGDSPYGSPMGSAPKSSSSSGKKKGASSKKKKSSSKKKSSGKRSSAKKSSPPTLALVLAIWGLIQGLAAISLAFIPCIGVLAFWPGVIAASIAGIALWMYWVENASPVIPVVAVCVGLGASGIALYQYQQVKEAVEEVAEDLVGGTEKDAEGWITKIPENGAETKKTTVTQINQMWEQDQEQVQKAFKGYWVEVTGTVKSFSVPRLHSHPDPANTRFAFVLQGDDPEGSTLECQMAIQYAWRYCRVGDKITIKGVLNTGALTKRVERGMIVTKTQGVPQMTVDHLMQSKDWEQGDSKSSYEGKWCEVQFEIVEPPPQQDNLKFEVDGHVIVIWPRETYSEGGVEHKEAIKKLTVGQKVIFLGKVRSYNKINLDEAIIVK